jgi:hypothetical protein
MRALPLVLDTDMFCTAVANDVLPHEESGSVASFILVGSCCEEEDESGLFAPDAEPSHFELHWVH